MTTISVLGARLPASGGAYLRHFPLWIISRAFQDAAAEGAPGMLYVHPWEVDPGQPRIPDKFIISSALASTDRWILSFSVKRPEDR